MPQKMKITEKKELQKLIENEAKEKKETIKKEYETRRHDIIHELNTTPPPHIKELIDRLIKITEEREKIKEEINQLKTWEIDYNEQGISPYLNNSNPQDEEIKEYPPQLIEAIAQKKEKNQKIDELTKETTVTLYTENNNSARETYEKFIEELNKI